jgi:23S rRNA-/tRNA-specific pseudouridylate synthase
METSGLLLASKHKKAESYLKSSFESSWEKEHTRGAGMY